MIVVSNTSPLCYLAWIDSLDLLVELFDEITIPAAVLAELNAPATPTQVRQHFTPLPSWLKIKSVEGAFDRELDKLHLGEKQAIRLAEELGADLILLDEKDARSIAARRGIALTGLLGILDEAANRQLIQMPEAIDKLKATSFRASPTLLKSLLQRHT